MRSNSGVSSYTKKNQKVMTNILKNEQCLKQSGKNKQNNLSNNLEILLALLIKFFNNATHTQKKLNLDLQNLSLPKVEQQQQFLIRKREIKTGPS